MYYMLNVFNSLVLSFIENEINISLFLMVVKLLVRCWLNTLRFLDKISLNIFIFETNVV